MTDKYFGWGPNRELSKEDRIYMAKTQFDIISESDDRFIDFNLRDAKVEKFMAWWATRKLFGKDILHIYQQTGSCVGAGHGNMINYSQAIEIALKGQSEGFRYCFFPYHYGIGRKYAGMSSKGEGSWGSAQAKAILEKGTISDELQGLPQVGKSSLDWSVSSATELDWSGQDRDRTWDYEDYEDVGIQHKFKKAAQVTSADAMFTALFNGYVGCVCSNVGFNRINSAGFNEPGPTWNHCMSIIGGDKTYKEPYFMILNQWGDVHGRMKDFETGEEYPHGLLRVRASVVDKMLRQGDSFVFTQYEGFEPQDLTFSAFSVI